MVFTMKNNKPAIIAAVQKAQQGPVDAINIYKQDVDKTAY
jgi:hypothetical protein